MENTLQILPIINWMWDRNTDQFNTANLDFSGLHYRQKYPQNPFLVEQDVQELCSRFGCVFGPLFSFNERIPGDVLSLHEEQSLPNPQVSSEVLKQSVPSLFQNFRGDVMMRVDYGGGIFDSSFKYVLSGVVYGTREQLVSENLLCPLGPNIGVLVGDGTYKIVFCVSGVNNNVLYYDVTHAFYLQNFSVSLDTGGGRRILRAEISNVQDKLYDVKTKDFDLFHFEIELGESSFANVEELIYGLRPLDMIIAPFDQFSNEFAFDIVDDYKLQLTDQNVYPPAIFGYDPIILTPVAGGYLFKKQWGPEMIQIPGAN